MNCPNCDKECAEPTENERGGFDKRGWYCSTQCKAELVGFATIRA